MISSLLDSKDGHVCFNQISSQCLTIKVVWLTDTSIDSQWLNFTHVSRDNIGTYVCTANNGVNPADHIKVNLDVTCE